MTLTTIKPDDDYLTPEQVAQLLRAINKARVSQDGKGFSHVQAYELRAHLNRIFGFGRWSDSVCSLDLVFEQGEDKQGRNNSTYKAWTVCYRAVMRVEIYGPRTGKLLAFYEDGATGEGINQPSRGDAHDLAMKTALSQAFKRALVNLGDQFANSLYGGGSLAALTKRTLLMPEVKAADEGIDDDAAPVVPEDAPHTAEPDPRITNAQQPAAPALEQPAEPAVDPAEREKQRKQAAADRIRQAALDPPPEDWAGSPVRWISHLMGEAVQHKVQNAHVESLLSSTQVALRVMLEQRMKQLADENRVAS